MGRKRKMNGLVEIMLIADYLCPAERFSLGVRQLPDAYVYYETSFNGESKLAKSADPLDVNQLVSLLNARNWFDCEITLMELEDAQLEFPERFVYGGDYPLLSCSSVHPEIPDHFKAWVRAECKKILSDRVIT
jgi:hypothetical protein